MLRLAETPAELSDESREREWSVTYADSWHEYLTQLEQIDDRELVLKTHEARLREVLDNPQFVPDHVLVRVRKFLKPSAPADNGNANAP